jgi:hypothetical protein
MKMNAQSKFRLIASAIAALVLITSLGIYATLPSGRIPAKSDLSAVSGTFKMNTLNSGVGETRIEILLDGDPTVYVLRGNRLTLNDTIDTIMTNTPKRLDMLVEGSGPIKEIWEAKLDGVTKATYEQMATARAVTGEVPAASSSR